MREDERESIRVWVPPDRELRTDDLDREVADTSASPALLIVLLVAIVGGLIVGAALDQALFTTPAVLH